MTDQKPKIPVTVDLLSEDEVDQSFHEKHRTTLIFEVGPQRKPFTFFTEALFDRSPVIHRKIKDNQGSVPVPRGNTTVWAIFQQWMLQGRLCKNLTDLKWVTLVKLNHFSEVYAIHALSNDIIIHFHRRRRMQLENIGKRIGLHVDDDEQESKKPTNNRKKKPILEQQEVLDLLPQIPRDLDTKTKLHKYLVHQFAFSHLQLVPELRANDLKSYSLHFLWDVLNAFNTAIDIHFSDCKPIKQVYLDEEQPQPDFSTCNSDLMNLVVRSAAVLRKELGRTRKVEIRQSFFGVKN
ncbi:uncharacterized protein K452DRAFT_356652 [Aplosporella prunicola CBS 121167]|uniref:Uncharacterized protein n=1 Tax=Aplosporella prunicola CBS 121167 TaxID=1176127 RepID=A0A6A6BME6_9PEZI|nr:uncharacterized protein K452DRAFT_356652 [Aplosporella prunicola CBS 121167]KAF2144464.1 hypothetical protein K452DRAFT_356652 [Aplosporella prunicola CBS 121167]